LQKELENYVSNNVFSFGVLDKKEKHNNNKTQNQTYKFLPESGNETGTSRTRVGFVTSEPLSQLKVWIVVKLFQRNGSKL